MRYCSGVPYFSRPQMGVFLKRRAEYHAAAIPKLEARFKQQEAAGPKTPPASGFFSSVAKLPQRVCVWIKEKTQAAHFALLKFGYESALVDSWTALDSALSGEHDCSSKRHLHNLANCRARASANLKALKLLNPAVAKKLGDAYNDALTHFSRFRIEDLDKLQKKMAALEKKQNAARKSEGYGLANDLCMQLMLKAKSISQPTILPPKSS
jgi:hypothetical protein